MNIEINYLAVLAAGVVGMAVGFLWYSPMLFGKMWMKEMGLSAEKMKSAQKEMGKLYALSFVGSLVTAYVLSHVMGLSQNYYSYTEVMTGVTTAFWMWLGFMMPVQMTGTIFSDKNWRLFSINTGYQLVALILMGLVVAWL